MPPHKKIPDRWTDYTAVGRRIPGTRFITFKVPLKPALSRFVRKSEIFRPCDLQYMLENQGQELGLIIDLTFTTRYYKPQDLPETCWYLKIFTAGHEVPSDSVILSFKKAVRSFLRENDHNDKLIGVHCTHGLNRTGYLVCRYLIDVDGLEPHKAIELFNSSRGHSIERQNYLEDLKSGPRRSNDGMEEPDQEPVQGGVMQRSDTPNFAHSDSAHSNSFYSDSSYSDSSYSNPAFSRRGPAQHQQNRPFQQRTVNYQSDFGAPGLLGPGPPALLALSQAPWPRRPGGGRFQDHHSSISAPPYPSFLPQYRWGGGASAFPPGSQETVLVPHRKSRHRAGKSQHNQRR